MVSEYFSYNDIEWQCDSEYTQRYGLVSAGGGRWAVVQDDNSTPYLLTNTLTTVTGRQTALGFIKLLLEK